MHRDVVAQVQAVRRPNRFSRRLSQQDGAAVLMAPPAHGFNVMGYLVPGLAVASVGLALVAWLTRRREPALRAGCAGAGSAARSPMPNQLRACSRRSTTSNPELHRSDRRGRRWSRAALAGGAADPATVRCTCRRSRSARSRGNAARPGPARAQGDRVRPRHWQAVGGRLCRRLTRVQCRGACALDDPSALQCRFHGTERVRCRVLHGCGARLMRLRRFCAECGGAPAAKLICPGWTCARTCGSAA